MKKYMCVHCGVSLDSQKSLDIHQKVCRKRNIVGKIIAERKDFKFIEMPLEFHNRYKEWLRYISGRVGIKSKDGGKENAQK